MNTTVPWSMEGGAEGARESAQRPGRSRGDWLDEAMAEDPHGARPPAAGGPDHRADMRAIAAQLARLSGAGEAAPSPDTAGVPRIDPRAVLRDAVAAIARRQAALDGHGGAPEPSAVPPAVAPPLSAPPSLSTPLPRPDARAAASRRDLLDGTAPWSAPDAAAPPPIWQREPAGLRRAGIDLTSEVSQTFARFSRDLQDAIRATDARPKVEALDRQVRQIGRAVDGLGTGLPAADAIARIGEQTREMRDLLKAASGRSVPLDAMERQVASLEARLGRLAALPVPPAPAPPPPDFAETMAEVRALLDGFRPGAALASLETRLDDITERIERGLDARGPAGLIEGLSRRVDEIHSSLRTQLVESAVDTGPLEGLVRGLSERIGQAREASADFKHLETAMRDVANRIEGVDPRGVEAITAQLARLAEQLDRSETSLKALDGVEHSLGELFSQFEVTRQVAIDAAETAARTAARDTLRAALQNPSLTLRQAEPPAFADQLVRGLDDLRAMQDLAERRTWTALSDMQATLERVAQQVNAPGRSEPRVAAAERPPVPAEEPRPRRAAPPLPSPEMRSAALDPADMLIEPGFGRGPVGSSPRAEPRFGPEPSGEEASPAAAAVEGDGPASFIAAARRAAQAAQASAASAASLKTAERRPAPHASGSRGRSSDATGTLGRARAFLAHRRRPMLLGLAALVLLVGALEVVKLGTEPREAARLAAFEPAAPGATRMAGLAPSAATADSAAAPSPPVAAPAPLTPPPLPTFVAGPGKVQAPASADGIGEGLRRLASAGDAGAQYEVGLRYAEGRGATRDPKQAVAWFERAAAQGSAPAQYRLGSAYEKGVGAERDPILAISWYGKAADAGNIRAMHNLAVMSAEGAAGKPDYARAAQWFGKASTFGVRDSQFNLAILYARGLGIEQSLAQSYTWFAIAAAEGDDDAGKKRDEVAAKLDPKVTASAKAAADAYRAATPPAAANEVPPPPGGWDAVAPRAPTVPTPGAKVSRL